MGSFQRGQVTRPEINRSQKVVRFPICVVLLDHSDEPRTQRIEDEVGESDIGLCSGKLSDGSCRIDQVKVLIGEVHKNDGVFDDEDVKILRAIASQLGVAIVLNM